jgi:hypothetical protein
MAFSRQAVYSITTANVGFRPRLARQAFPIFKIVEELVEFRRIGARRAIPEL